MKERLSLLDVCKIPDVQIHSKTAFLKKLINQQSVQTLKMKDQIVNLSYTVKTIGVQGQQVGITSKRLPLKLKKKQDHPPPLIHSSSPFLPHQSFYAHALIPLRKEKEQSTLKKNQFQIFSARNTIHIEPDASYQTQKFKIRTKSMAQMRKLSFKKDQYKNQNLEQLGIIKDKKRVNSEYKRQSFSGMLKQCTITNQGQSINPLLHQQNPLFKKIKRIKQVYPDICQEKMFLMSRNKTKFSASSNLLRLYQQEI